MRSIICTLFEGDYHFGVAALVNSLYQNGFRGEIYAGFRGTLPPWAVVTEQDSKNETNTTQLKVAKGLDLFLIQVSTEIHLTNYKPHFLMDILERTVGKVDIIAYFDPDITLQMAWSVVEEWTADGCLVCADVNWNMPDKHPIRDQWLKHFGLKRSENTTDINLYVNAGFASFGKLGLKCLRDWRDLIGRSRLNLTKMGRSTRPDCFAAIDQDIFNLALMINSSEVRILGPEAMGFQPGRRAMTHAIMSPKPWSEKIWRRLLNGIGPSVALVDYLNATQAPIEVVLESDKKYMLKVIALARFINRFYRRSS